MVTGGRAAASTRPGDAERPVSGQGIGAAVRRKEDLRFLLGLGRFVDDMVFPGELYCHVVRSPHAHARIRSIDTAVAAAAPGVIAVFTGADMEADDVGPMLGYWNILSKDGNRMAEPPRWPLARGKARHVGDPVAAVIAESREGAADAAELVAVDYEPLPAVAGSRDALAPEAPQLHEEAPGNVCYRFARGDEGAVARAFAGAAHTVRIDLVNNRLAGAAIEGRAVVAVPEPASGDITLYDTTQSPHHMRRFVSTELGLPETKLRVISPDVGGGFGYKGKHYPEETLIAWAARRLNRPVRWSASRAESFITDTQGRDHLTHADLALDADGKFLALRVDTMANIGAYISTMAAGIPSAIYTALFAGVYTTPAIYVEVTAVFTNTVPVDAYRGAGRPEACYVLERLADGAARKLGLDRAEIRRRNLIPADAVPYATPIGPVYDSGDFPRIMARTLEISNYAGFAERRREAEGRGMLRGIGIANYIESSGVAPSKLAGMLGARGGFYEAAEIRVDPGGGAQVLLGTHNHGQGHATTFAQIVTDRLGIPLDRIEVIEGDTNAVPIGTGTFGSRSTAVGGSALDRAAQKVIDKGRRIAAHLLEAAEPDVEFAGGVFSVAGTDRRIAFTEVARAAHAPHNYPLEELEPGLHESAYYDPPNFAYSNGSHVCEIEIDPETGSAAIVGYWVVDDVGTVINPMIVEGQVHGGLAQGIGQALTEICAYDPESGQLLSGSFMDYAVPRADDLPSFVSELDESQPCTHNPLGAKGCGESGTIGAPAAIASAVLDALGPLGVDDVEMPLTPARLWRVIKNARDV